MLRAPQATGWKATNSFSARPCNAVMPIDQVVTIRGDLRQQDRTREVSRLDGFFIEVARTVVWNVGELNELNGKSVQVSRDKGNEP